MNDQTHEMKYFHHVSPIYSNLPKPNGIMYTTFDLLSPSGCRAFVLRSVSFFSPGRVTILKLYLDVARLNCCERPSTYGTTYVPFVLSVYILVLKHETNCLLCS